MSSQLAHLLTFLALLAAAILFFALGDKDLALTCLAAALGAVGGASIEKTLGK